MNYNKTKKCSYCNKVFFDIGKDECPFCKKNTNDLDALKDLFGEDNPFDTFRIT